MKVHGQLNQEQIEALKKKHNVSEVYEVIVPLDDEGEENLAAYLKRPDRKVLAPVMAIMQSNPIKANEILVNGCWLEGDVRMKTDDDAFMSMVSELGELINVRKGEIKKK